MLRQEGEEEDLLPSAKLEDTKGETQLDNS